MSAGQQPKRKRRWLKGCAMGCGGFLVLAAILIAAAFLFFRGSFDDRFAANYELARQEGKLSDEEQDVFYDLMASIQRPETGMSASAYACILLDRCLNAPDGPSREKAVAAATDMRELLASNASPGIREVMGVMEKYPELSIRNWKAKRPPATAPQP